MPIILYAHWITGFSLGSAHWSVVALPEKLHELDAVP